MSLLEVDGINSYYGDSHILFDVSLTVERNEVVALLGRNGAGKSTTLKSLAGVVRAQSGRIRLDGEEVQSLPSYRVAQRGVQLVPEERRIFGSLSVEENLVVGGLTARRAAGRCRGSTRRFRVSPKGSAAAAPTFPAANSRCSRSPAR